MMNVDDKSGVVIYPKNTKQSFVMIDNSKLGSFSFEARASLYFDYRVVTASAISGKIMCSEDTSPFLIAPPHTSVTMQLDEKTPL